MSDPGANENDHDGSEAAPTPDDLETTDAAPEANDQPDDSAVDDVAERAKAADAAIQLLESLDPEEHFKNVASLARASHGSALQPDPYIASLEFHQPTCVVVDPEPDGSEIMELYGRAAYPKFDEVVVAAFQKPELDHLLTDIHHRLVHENSNIALVTNHGELIDIALVLGALTIAMSTDGRTFGVLDESIETNEMIERSNLLLSRMVATRAIFNIPVPQVLKAVCRCFYSIPQTQSRRKARLEGDVVRANNDLMRHRLNQQLDGGGQILAMAASGSQDLSLAANLVTKVRAWRSRRHEEPARGDSLHLQPLYNGTIQLMLRCRYVLPVSISLNGDSPVCTVGGLTRVQNEKDCHSIMDWIATSHEESTGVTTVYHQREDDFLSQVREALRH